MQSLKDIDRCKIVGTKALNSIDVAMCFAQTFFLNSRCPSINQHGTSTNTTSKNIMDTAIRLIYFLENTKILIYLLFLENFGITYLLFLRKI